MFSAFFRLRAARFSDLNAPFVPPAGSRRGLWMFSTFSCLRGTRFSDLNAPFLPAGQFHERHVAFSTLFRSNGKRFSDLNRPIGPTGRAKREIPSTKSRERRIGGFSTFFDEAT